MPQFGEIRWDSSIRRFRYPEGTLATREAVQYQTERFIKAKQNELVQLAPSLSNDPTNLELRRQVAETLRDIHVASASLAAGGPDKLFANDYLIVARNLKNQYGLTDNNPKEYGLKFLYEDIGTGRTSPSWLVHRLEMYSKSSKTSFYTVQIAKKKQEGFAMARRVLAFGENCKECGDYSGWGWVGINDLIPPTQKCSCLTNCNCTVEYKANYSHFSFGDSSMMER